MNSSSIIFTEVMSCLIVPHVSCPTKAKQRFEIRERIYRMPPIKTGIKHLILITNKMTIKLHKDLFWYTFSKPMYRTKPH